MTPEEKTIFKKVMIRWAIAIVTVMLLGGFYTVAPGERAFTVTFGKIGTTTYTDGLHWRNVITTKAVKFDIQTQKLETNANASSKDLQTVTSNVSLNYSIDEKQIINLYTTIGSKNDIESRIIQPTLQEVIKAVTAKYTAEGLIGQREAVSSDIIKTLKERLTSKGIVVQAFNIINFEFSKQFNDAIESKVTAEQDALAQKNKLEQVKYEWQQKIVSAQAEAEKIKIQAQAIQANGGTEYVQLQMISKRNGQLPTMVTSSNTNLLMWLDKIK